MRRTVTTLATFGAAGLAALLADAPDNFKKAAA